MTVYFIGDSERVKIGFASKPKQRRKEIQVGCPFPVQILRTVAGGVREEAWLHAHYEHLSLNGEWFRHCPTMLTVEVPVFPQVRLKRLPPPKRTRPPGLRGRPRKDEQLPASERARGRITLRAETWEAVTKHARKLRIRRSSLIDRIVSEWLASRVDTHPSEGTPAEVLEVMEFEAKRKAKKAAQ